MAGKPPGPIGFTNNPVIDPYSLSLDEMLAPGLRTLQCVALHRDEITPIARYIASEMNMNAQGPNARRMNEMNGFSPEACIADFTKLPLWKQMLGVGVRPEQCIDMGISYHGAALIAWGLKVRQNGDWDHKPKIATLFRPRVPGGQQHWHLYGNTLYFYDVWSNLHYGYVGMAAGFSESVLLDGAGLEQIGSDLVRLNAPSKSAADGLRAWDDPSDRAAIKMGVELYRSKPQSVTTQDVLNLVLSSNAIRKKPYSP